VATILTVLDALVQFEENLRDLYVWLSDVYSRDPVASGTFYRLSLKEASHVNLVKYQRRLVHENAANLRYIEVDVSEIRQILGGVREFRRRPDAPQLEEALDFTIELEMAAAERVHTTATAHQDPGIETLMGRLAGDDRKHYEILKKAAR
jgi:rubrerythrin